MPLIKTAPAQDPSGSRPRATPSFANCQRGAYSGDFNDWLNLSQDSNFDICPSCFNASFKNTQYAQFIVASPPKPDNIATRCDFSDLWVRVAYGWLYTQQHPSLDLLSAVASIHDAEGTCPNLDPSNNEAVKKGDRPAAERTWYCVFDPSTSTLVDDLTTCSHCVNNIHTIFPSLAGIFAPAANGEQVLATCDLTLPQHIPRTLNYIDEFVKVAESTLKTGSSVRNMTPLVTYLRKWAPIPLCKNGAKVTDPSATFYALTQVPEWTVCEEHYTSEIAPLFQKPSPQSPPILSQIVKLPSPPHAGYTCQLYTPRLQSYFTSALSTSDLSDLRTKITTRNTKLVEVRAKMQNLQMQFQQARMAVEHHRGMMTVQQSTAMVQTLSYTLSGWHAPPVDYRGANAEMGQMGQAQLEMNMRLGEMQMLEAEWEENWE